jgi:peptidoglycan/LPS O-acetylase OafA/YrhL
MVPVTFVVFRSNFNLAGLPGALLILPATQETWLAVEWTLRHEVVFYLLFALCLWKPKLGLPVLALWAIVSIGDIIFNYKNQWTAWFLARFHLLFAAGMVAAWLFINNRIAKPRVLFVLGVLLFSATWALNCTLNPWPQKFYEMLYGAGAFLIITGIVRLEELGNVRVPSPLVFVGDASYAIYLINFPVISAAAKVGMAFRQVPGGEIIAWIFAMVLALVVGCLFHLFVEKPILRFFTRITKKWASPSAGIESSQEAA